MLRRFLCLTIVFFLLPQLGASAQLGQNFSIKTFQPYFKRNYNTLLGWKGFPVDLTDPHVYLYRPKTSLPMAQIEFLYANKKIHSEVLKVYQSFEKLDFQHKQEINWFLLTSTEGKVTFTHLERLFKMSRSKSKCSQGQLGPYLLTFLVNSKETILKISLKPEVIGCINDLRP